MFDTRPLIIALVTTCTCAIATPLNANEIEIAAFSRGDLSGWEEESFKGHSQYRLITLDDRQVLHATSDRTASGLHKEITIDLEKTPYLNWSWRVDQVLNGNDERAKSGDDYPARVYVVAYRGWAPWKTRAISYVWASHQPRGASWPNAFTGKAHMVAVQSGTENAGQWQQQRRNVREDFKQLFGKDIKEIHYIAIMTDTDNSGQSAQGYYGDIYFSD